MITTAPSWLRCWCDWCAEDEPGVSHDDHIEVYDYPFHLPSAEWNVPEPREA